MAPDYEPLPFYTSEAEEEMDLATWLREASSTRPAGEVADIGILQGAPAEFVGADDGFDTLVQAVADTGTGDDGANTVAIDDEEGTASAGKSPPDSRARAAADIRSGPPPAIERNGFLCRRSR